MEENAIGNELLHILNQVYYSTLRVDLVSDSVLVLQSRDRPDLVSKQLSWDAYIAEYSLLLTEQGRTAIRERLAPEHLRAAADRGEQSFSLDVSYTRQGTRKWLKITTLPRKATDGHPYAYILVQRTDDEHLLKSIIDLYVYNTCDYFIYLDARNNSYRMFSSSSSGTPLPPEICEDYDTALVEYAYNFVVPEDQEMVIREMRIGRVLEQLERHGIHSFYAGVVDPVRGYTRKQLTYRYYDRDAQMVLLSRTDVTDVYLEERARQKELQKAQFLAQMDTLTGLFNYRGTVDHITDAISENSGSAALLFIDLDNFKQINDSLGHLAGDQYLKRVAQVLQMQTGEQDIHGRVGGDEFVVFLRSITGRQQAADCAGRICKAISRLSLPENGAPSVSCSIGIAIVPEDGRDYKTLVGIADKLAYRAKRQGKNRFLL